EGQTDWAHWGLDPTNLLNHKGGVTQQIAPLTLIGTAVGQEDTANPIGYSWSDGAPVVSVTNTATALVVTGLMNGFEFSVPADTLPRQVKVYVGAEAAQGRFQAALSDASAPAYTESSLDDPWESTNGVYTLNYAAASTGQVLTVT